MRKLALTALAGLLAAPALALSAGPAAATEISCTRSQLSVTPIRVSTPSPSASPSASPTASPSVSPKGKTPVIVPPTSVRITTRGQIEVPCHVNVSTYKLLPTYKPSPDYVPAIPGDGNFNASATGQILIKNRIAVLSREVTSVTIPLDIPECGWFQWDVYSGEVQTKINFPGGHGSAIISGHVTSTSMPKCPEPTPTPSVTPSQTPTPTPSVTPSETPSPSVTPSESASPSATPSVSVSPSASPSPTVSGVSYTAPPAPTALPKTGSTTAPYILGGLLLLLAGAGLVYFTRKTKAAQHG